VVRRVGLDVAMAYRPYCFTCTPGDARIRCACHDIQVTKKTRFNQYLTKPVRVDQ